MTAIRRIAGGDLTTHVPIERDDELGELAQTVNNLARELRDSKEKLLFARHHSETIMRTVADGMVMIDNLGQITSANPTALQMLEYPGHQIQQVNVAQIFEERSWFDHVAQLIDEFLDVDGLEVIMKTRHGMRLPVLLSTSIMRAENGSPAGMVLTARDITDQLQIEEDRRRLAAIVEGSHDLIAILTLDGHVLFLNNAGKRLLAIDDFSHLVGKRLFDFCPEEISDTFQKKVLDPLQDSNFLQLETPLSPRNKSQRIPAALIFTLINNPKSNKPDLISVIGRDITERQEAMEKLREYASNLEISNRELEQFAFVASHDLREPLRKLHNFTQLIEKRYQEKLDDKGRQILGYMSSSALRMLRLIKDLLEYSRLGNHSTERVWASPDRIVREAVGALSLMVREKNADIIIRKLPDTIYCTPELLTQVFQNLIANSLKFHGDKPPRIEVGAATGRTDWEFYIRDYGIGIDPVHADRIFVIFQRLQEAVSYDGTGIGLSICKKVIDLHGGKITVQVPKGKGTLFRFTIPKHDPDLHGPDLSPHLDTKSAETTTGRHIA